MKETTLEKPEAPVWARDDAFPAAPAGWGWIDAKGKPHACNSQESLAAAIRDDRDASVTLVWAPSHARMILPEELEGMGDALRTARELSILLGQAPLHFRPGNVRAQFRQDRQPTESN